MKTLLSKSSLLIAILLGLSLGATSCSEDTPDEESGSSSGTITPEDVAAALQEGFETNLLIHSNSDLSSLTNGLPIDLITGDPVGCMTGAAFATETDIRLSTPDIPLEFRRAYASVISGSGDMGRGWTHSFAETLSPICIGGIEWMVLKPLVESDQPVHVYFLKKPDGSFCTMNGAPYALSVHADGSFVVKGENGESRTFASDGVLEAIGHNGATVMTLEYSNRSDPNARRLTRVRHICGKSLYLSYDENGNLSHIALDSPDSFVDYGYETGSQTHLVSVRRTDYERTSDFRYRYGTGQAGLTNPASSIVNPYATNSCSDALAVRMITSNPEADEGLLVEATDPNGVSSHFVYMCHDDSGTARAVYTSVDGGLLETDLEHFTGRTVVRKQVNGKETTREVFYNPDTKRIYADICEGVGCRTIFDDVGNPIARIVGDTNSMQGVISTFAYDEKNCLTNWGEGFNCVPSNCWSQMWDDLWRKPQTVCSPEGRSSHWERNGLSLFVYDAGTNSPLGRSIVQCNAAWNITNAVDANGHARQLIRSQEGYVVKEQGDGLPSVEFEYDAFGNVSKRTMPGPGGVDRVEVINRNCFGKPLQIIHCDGTQERWEYDNEWILPVSYIDELGRKDDYEWVQGLPVKSARTLSNSIITPLWSVKHDRQMNIVSIIDPLGRVAAAYEYDANERVVSVTNLEGQVQRYSYIGVDRIGQIDRFDGSVVEKRYAPDGNLSEIGFDDETVRFEYDRDGLMTCVSNVAGTVNNEYNEASWLSETTGADGTTLAYGYHPAGQIASVESIVGETEYELDEANRVSRIDAPHSTFDFEYCDWNGRVSSITNGVGVVKNLEYDLRDRVTNIVYRAANGSEIARFDYTRDSLGRISGRAVSFSSSILGCTNGVNSPLVTTYRYDDLDRLADESDSNGSSRTYSYDLADNRVRKTGSASGTVDYTLGLGDRIATYTGGAYEYNPAGCVTNISEAAGFPNEPHSRALAWNAQYQLLSVATNGAVAESYTWDPLGRRASTSTSVGTIRHVYDGNQCIADLDESGSVIRSYVWGPGIDNLLSVAVADGNGQFNVYYALTDHQNTVHGFVDDTGSLVARYVYDAWGNILECAVVVPSLADSRYLFQGREYSWATRLYNFRSRWYDPITGRWLSKDPIGLAGGINLYAFCGNDPINHVDPLGTTKWKEIEYVFEPGVLVLNICTEDGRTWGMTVPLPIDPEQQ